MQEKCGKQNNAGKMGMSDDNQSVWPKTRHWKWNTQIHQYLCNDVFLQAEKAKSAADISQERSPKESDHSLEHISDEGLVGVNPG